MRTRLALGLAGAAAALVLAAGSTVALAAATGNLGARSDASTGYGPAGPMGPYAARPPTSSCTVPSLPGSVAEVTLTDMGGYLGRYPGGDGGAPGRGYGMMGGAWAGADPTTGTGTGSGPTGDGMMRGAMSVQVSPVSVPAGTVSLTVANDGSLTHELVVLPLAAGVGPGQRTIGSDGTVAETGSLGEASATCAAGAGEGIAAGSDGWLTLDLAPGRYELVCNLPGHYAAGMYTELDVTG